MLEQSDEKIIGKVSKIEDALKLFDGEIDVSEIQATEKDFLKTKDELQSESDNRKRRLMSRKEF